jgi:hypothetical protein
LLLNTLANESLHNATIPSRVQCARACAHADGCNDDMTSPCSAGYGRGCTLEQQASGCPVCNCPYSEYEHTSFHAARQYTQGVRRAAVPVLRAWRTKSASACYLAKSRVQTASACRSCTDGTDE